MKKSIKMLIALLTVLMFVVGMTACSTNSSKGVANTQKTTSADSNTDENQETASESISTEDTKSNTKASTSAKTSSDGSDDIGENRAKQIAFNKAGVEENQVKNLKISQDYDDGQLEYHIDFYVNNKEYEYEISAKTGKILSYDIDNSKSNTESVNADESSSDIGREKAKNIALKKAGIQESQTRNLIVEKDYEGGQLQYEVEFYADGKEYSYEISASTGKIISYDIDIDD